MDFLTNLLENSHFSWLSAFLLGLMTSISPCPLATNITAIGYIGKDIDNRHKVFISGLIFTLGRAITYFVLAAVIFFGLDHTKISFIFQKFGSKLIGPFLFIIGILMLDIFKIYLPALNPIISKFQNNNSLSYLNVLLLGMLFALAFCPYSAVLYFGILIPMTITSIWGLYLPILFAIGTGLPVIIFSYLLAYTVANVGNAYNKLKIFELWFRRLIALLFIFIGILYIFKNYILK